MKRFIKINENTLNRLFVVDNKKGSLLTEGWAKTKRTIVSRCVDLIKRYCPWYEDDDANALELEKKIEQFFFEGSLAGSKVRKYEPMITKILVSELGYPTNPFINHKSEILRKIVKIINEEIEDNHIEPKAYCAFDNDTRQVVCDDYKTLLEKYHDDLHKQTEVEKFERKEVEDNSDYEVIKIDDFNTANHYGNYSNPHRPKLCYTQNESTWNNYTNGGLNVCYLCLNKNTWQKWDIDQCPEDNDEMPYDEYGLSMIWVFVDPNGKIVFSNTRWNHHMQGNIGKFTSIYGGTKCDYSFNENAIQNITKYPFTKTFKPNASVSSEVKKIINWVRQENDTNSGSIVRDLLAGRPFTHDKIEIQKLNENIAKVTYKGFGGKLYYILDLHTFKLLFEGKLNAVSEIDDGLFIIETQKKYNILDSDGNLLLPQWPNYLLNVGKGCFVVKFGVAPFKDKIGVFSVAKHKFINETWGNNYYYRNNLNGKQFISFDGKNGNILSIRNNGELEEITKDEINAIINECLRTKNYVYEDNGIDLWIKRSFCFVSGDNISYPNINSDEIKPNDLYTVSINGMFNIGLNGKLMLPMEIDDPPFKPYGYMGDNIMGFYKGNKLNLVGKNGILINTPYEEWPEKMYSYDTGCALKYENGHFNFTDGERFLIPLDTPIEYLPNGLYSFKNFVVLGYRDYDSNLNRGLVNSKLFDVNTWSFVLDGNDFNEIDIENCDYTKDKILFSVTKNGVEKNFYDAENKRFILQNFLLASNLKSFGYDEGICAATYLDTNGNGRYKRNFISPEGEFMFGENVETWPYDIDGEFYSDYLTLLEFIDGVGLADFNEFKMISDEHFKYVEVVEDDYRYYKCARKDGSIIYYDYESESFVRPRTETEDHFGGYDGTSSIVDFLEDNFDWVGEYIQGQIYAVCKYEIDKYDKMWNIVAIDNDGKPMLMLPTWYAALRRYDNLVECETNRYYNGSRLSHFFNLKTMDYVTDEMVLSIRVLGNFSDFLIKSPSNSSLNIINQDGKLVVDDGRVVENYERIDDDLIKLEDENGYQNIYLSEERRLASNNWYKRMGCTYYNNICYVTDDESFKYPIKRDGNLAFTDYQIDSVEGTRVKDIVFLEFVDGSFNCGNVETEELLYDRAILLNRCLLVKKDEKYNFVKFNYPTEYMFPFMFDNVNLDFNSSDPIEAWYQGKKMLINRYGEMLQDETQSTTNNENKTYNMKNRRYITINESTFNRLFLTEDTRTDQAIARTKNVIRRFFESKNPFARWIRNGAWDLDAPFNHPDNPKGLSNLDYMFEQFEENFLHSPDLRKSAIRRLEPSFAQMAFEAGFQQAQYGAHDIKKQNRIKRIIWKMFFSQEKEKAVEGMSEAEIERVRLENEKASIEGKKISQFPSDNAPIMDENDNVVGYNLTSYDTINEIYGRQIDEDDAAETERIDTTQYVKNGSYNIIGPVSYDVAHKYAEVSGDKEATETKICYGMFPSTWEDYTFEDKFKVYIALRNDWGQVEPTITKKQIDSERETAKAEGRKPNVHYPSAYDDYGMSMIWVIIDDDGNLATCNTRWNHLGIYKKGRSVDWALTREEISDVVGRNFMQEFRYDKETVNDVSDDNMAVNGEPENEFNEACFADEETIREADEETLAVIRNFIDNGESWDEVFDDEENYQGLTNLQFVKYQFDSLFFNEENLNRSIIVRFKPLFCQVALENGFIESENDPTFREDTARPIANVIWNLFNIANTSEEYAAQINEIPNDVSYDELANYAERTINEIENASNNSEY